MATQTLTAERLYGNGLQCKFCQSLLAPHKVSEKPVAASDHFVAWPSVGALVPGHVLVIPRRHMLNLQGLISEENEEFPRLVGALRAALSTRYGPIAAFEHGPVHEGSPVGCSVDHAHLHLLPWAGSLVALAQRSYPELEWHPMPDLTSALQFASTSYLAVEDAHGSAAVATGPTIPSQALRRAICKALGRSGEWDWKTHPQEANVLQTISELSLTPS